MGETRTSHGNHERQPGPSTPLPVVEAAGGISNAAFGMLIGGSPSATARGISQLTGGIGNAALARVLARQGADGGLPPGGAPQPTADPNAAAEALRIHAMPMDALLADLAARERLWIHMNRDALVHTPGVDPRRMALAVEAVLAGREASDERLTVMMGEMQAMGLPEDQQEAVARFCGAFGLRAPSILNKYVKGAAALKDEWPNLSASERAKRFGSLAAAQLVEAGVPAPTRVDVEPIEEGGLWDREQWRIVVSTKIGSLKSDADLFVRAAATIYHEARHAEQDFTILRSLAGQGKSDDEIAATYKAPMPIIKTARATPLAPTDPQAKRAADWLASTNAATPAPYADRPEERDAHGAGNTVADRLRGGAPPDRSSQLRDPWIPAVGQP